MSLVAGAIIAHDLMIRNQTRSIDAVFFPGLSTLDFAQEGHRLELAVPGDPQSALVYKGAVYNEMRGALSSPGARLWHALAAELYPTIGPEVIPVLLGGAEPPSAETLSEGLRPLCDLEDHRFIGKDADWQAQFERLCERLAATPGIPTPRFRLPSGQAQPFRVIKHLLSSHFQDPQGRLGELCTALESAGTVAVVARAALYCPRSSASS